MGSCSVDVGGGHMVSHQPQQAISYDETAVEMRQPTATQRNAGRMKTYLSVVP